MSITSIDTTVTSTKVLPPGHYNIAGLFRSEWTKLRTVRSTMWTIGVTVALGICLSAIACAETRSHWTPADVFGFDATRTSLIGVFFGQFTIGILGVLVMSAEYGTGTIRATFAAAPRRPLVLAAKATVFGVVVLVVSEIVAFISFFVGQALLTQPAIHTTLSSPGALRAVMGSGLYLFLLGLLALGLATMIRHTAGAISAFIGVLLVLPIIVSALPNSIGNSVVKFLPERIGMSIVSLHSGPQSFAPWPGMLLLAAYAIAALVIGGMLLVRRDA